MSKILPNLPIEDLTPENDYLNVIERGDMIKSFLLSNKEEFSQIKMFALYGEWGSGKSTLMKYLEKELKSDFNTFFFEAWEFESDDNLSNSLLEFLLDESESLSEEISGEILGVAEKLFTGFAKSIKISLPGDIFSINGKDFVEELKSKKPKSFLKLKKEFKTEFKRWEDSITGSKKPPYNIVFIDDLDRCEPENVLNLLSALKLFFTYGQKTIFFCGVDKKAVSQAVQTRYSDIVKSGEYLEKVFDISFKMSKITDIDKLIAHYFPSNINYNFQEKDQKLQDIISAFFHSLRFENPRKIKKLLNKFLIFKSLCKSLPEDHEYRKLLPNIFDEEVVLFDLIFTFYFLILIEFYPEKFNNVKNDSLRIINYRAIEADKASTSLPGTININLSIIINRFDEYKGFNFSKSSIKKKQTERSHYDELIFGSLIFNFTPVKPERIANDSFYSSAGFVKGFRVPKREIDYRFCNYLLINFNDILNQDIESSIKISEMYRLVKLMG